MYVVLLLILVRKSLADRSFHVEKAPYCCRPSYQRSRAKITGPQAIVSLGSDIARGLTSLGSSFLTANVYMALYEWGDALVLV